MVAPGSCPGPPIPSSRNTPPQSGMRQPGLTEPGHEAFERDRAYRRRSRRNVSRMRELSRQLNRRDTCPERHAPCGTRAMPARGPAGGQGTDVAQTRLQRATDAEGSKRSTRGHGPGRNFPAREHLVLSRACRIGGGLSGASGPRAGHGIVRPRAASLQRSGGRSITAMLLLSAM